MSDIVRNEDWLRTVSWDVTNADGTLVVSLDELAAVLDVTKREAATRVLTLPFGEAAPEHIRADAMSEVAE